MTTLHRLGLISQKRTALFLCDMQEKFSSTIQYFPAIVNVCSRLLKTAKILNMPVVVTEQYPKGLGHTVKEIGLREFPDVKPYEKTQWSMMTPEVGRWLEGQSHLQSVVICGIATHVCVQLTVQSLLRKGYGVHVVADGCSSQTAADRMISFQRMRDMGACLTTSESVIMALLEGSHHPNFKELQEIVLREPPPDTGLASLLPHISK